MTNDFLTYGRYQCEVFEGDKCVLNTGEFDNIITNHALAYGDPFSAGFLVVGTGKRDPRPSDRELQAPASAVAATFEAGATLMTIGEKLYAKKQVYAEFTNINAVITELGFRKTSEPDTVISRSLIRDGLGNKTRIPVQPHQRLKISYFVYVEIPAVLATGEVSTNYQTVEYTMLTSEAMTMPKGIYAARFNNPLGGSTSLVAITSTGARIQSQSLVWTYNSTLRRASAQAYFPAIETNRTIVGFDFGSSGSRDQQLPRITLSASLVNPANNDMTIPLSFYWGRGE